MWTREEKIRKKKEIISMVRESGLEEKNEIEDSLNGTSRIFKEVENYLTMSGLGETWVLLGKTLVNYKVWNTPGSNKGIFFNSKENYYTVKALEDLESFKQANEVTKEKLEDKVMVEEDIFQGRVHEIIKDFPNLNTEEFLNLISRFLRAQETEENLEMAKASSELNEKIAESKIEVSKKELDEKLKLSKDKKTRLKERMRIFNKIKGDKNFEIKVRELTDSKVKQFSKLGVNELKEKLK